MRCLQNITYSNCSFKRAVTTKSHGIRFYCMFMLQADLAMYMMR